MRILFLISDTGGGHRAGAVAVEAALKAIDPTIEVIIRDAMVEAAAWPSNHAPAIYNWGMQHARWVWGAFFYAMNGPCRARLFADLNWPMMARKMRHLVTRDAPDLIVSVHPLMTRAVARAIASSKRSVPFVTIVTDLVTGHATWYDRGADWITVPTEAARARAIACGCDPNRVSVTGQPLHPKALLAVADRDELRRRFGWTSKPVVLCVGGGDGMGNLGARVRALANARIPAHVVVICGRNESLRAELQSASFPISVEVHGFVSNLPEMMAAADLLVTKGGPGSVMEGCFAGLPILIYDYIPGQEWGNVQLVQGAGVGDYVPRPEDLPQAVLRWLLPEAERKALAVKARALVIPDSSSRIATGLLKLLQ